MHYSCSISLFYIYDSVHMCRSHINLCMHMPFIIFFSLEKRERPRPESTKAKHGYNQTQNNLPTTIILKPVPNQGIQIAIQDDTVFKEHLYFATRPNASAVDGFYIQDLPLNIRRQKQADSKDYRLFLFQVQLFGLKLIWIVTFIRMYISCLFL